MDIEHVQSIFKHILFTISVGRGRHLARLVRDMSKYKKGGALIAHNRYDVETVQ